MDAEHIADLYDVGHPASVVELGRRRLAEHPEDHVTRFFVAVALGDLARYEEAMTTFEHLLAHGPPEQAARFLSHMGLAQQQQGAWDLAEVTFRRAIDAQPDHSSRHIYLGALLARLGRLEEAEAIHRTATLCRFGHTEEAWFNLGLVLRALGRLDESSFCLRKALSIDPDFDDATRVLADVSGATRE